MNQINGKVVNPGTAMNGVEIRSVGRFTVADFDFGLVIRWDGKDRYVFTPDISGYNHIP